MEMLMPLDVIHLLEKVEKKNLFANQVVVVYLQGPK